MSTAAREKAFLKKLGNSYLEATPGLRLQAFRRGKKILDIDVGKTHAIYDWASVTKLVFTDTALMFRRDEGVLDTDDRISKWVPWWPEASTWRVRDLLSHSAGMTWWYPFYKTLIEKVPKNATPEEAWEIFQGVLKKRVLQDFKKQGPIALKRRPVKSVYSDLDYFLLGITNESLAGTTLYSVWADVRERTGLRDTDFHRENRVPKFHRDTAPTEDCQWRKKVVKGEVHDQNTWSLKGVAPHAGLFGPIDDLSKWGLKLRASLKGERKNALASTETVKLFTKRAIPRARGDWALGFMMPSKGVSSCGPRFSPESVGHTGFTGTSLWFDPKQDLLVTILTNRVHPTVENIKIRELRPLLHNWAVEATK